MVMMMTEDDNPTEPPTLSRGQLLALQDGVDAEGIMDKFGIFYTMRVWKEAIKDLQGLRGKTFKIAFGTRVGEIQSQYDPYDYYESLKEGTVPEFEKSKLSEVVAGRLDKMKKANERRMNKKKPLKHSVRAIDTYEEVLEALEEAGK